MYGRSSDRTGKWLADANSTNGTRFGVQPADPLRESNVIQFGSVAVRVAFAATGI